MTLFPLPFHGDEGRKTNKPIVRKWHIYCVSNDLTQQPPFFLMWQSLLCSHSQNWVQNPRTLRNNSCDAHEENRATTCATLHHHHQVNEFYRRCYWLCPMQLLMFLYMYMGLCNAIGVLKKWSSCQVLVARYTRSNFYIIRTVATKRKERSKL